ncbi:18988_t:CDS:2 [Funneliformis geosporum]|uniref:12423_t:CDS:1 n=1 Tax=Funneliformis geosporum TaxID=1117311 RepID=A0A9W4SHI6_9GLOM|nr:18988_t:CDS:2 [Funneliformis geosporum]CAI2169934.1 12423_t:CDS:2 [Funneliformis geosporum]
MSLITLRTPAESQGDLCEIGETNLANGECPEAIDFNSFIDTLCELRTSANLVKLFKSKKVQIRNNVESGELDNLVLKLNDQVQKILMQAENELNFVFIDGFLLYVNPDVIKQLDIKIFLKSDYDSLKKRRETEYGKKLLGRRWVDPPNYFDQMVWPNYIKANDHIINRSGRENDLLNDLIVLESNNFSSLSENIEKVVKIILEKLSKKDDIS